MDMHHSQEAHAEIREEVRKLCARFPGEYWRELDTRRGYPSEFVKALTDAGWLAALIPEEYGGSGLPLSAAAAILEEIHATGCNAAACHAQMYIMGSLLRHGSEAQKAQYLPQIASGALRLQAFGDDSASIKAFGLDVVTDLCEQLRQGGAPGLHIYTMNQSSAALALVQRLA